MGKRILVFQHAKEEDTGCMGQYLEQAGFTLDTIRLYAEEPIPADVSSVQGIISMGGPMAVWEEEKYPFLRCESALLRKAVESGLPVLGICLGAQMIAKAMGADVYKADQREIGWHTVHTESESEKDFLFTGLSSELHVFQYHEDTFNLPVNSILLARSLRCRNQAFRVNNAYGLQFHMEMNLPMLETWFRDRAYDRTRFCDGYIRLSSLLMKQNEILFGNLRRFFDRGIFHE